MKLVLMSILTMSLCIGLYGQRAENTFVEDNLENALLWMLNKGVPLYYSNISYVEIKNSLYAETSTVLYTSPNSNKPFFTLLFELWDVGKSKITNRPTNAYYTVICYLIDIQDDIVEYWVIKRSDRDTVYDTCLFVITVAETLQSSRRVQIKSENFIPFAEIGGRNIQFPQDDLNILYNLDARRWPRSYTNSELDEYQVKYRKGKPYLKKIGIVERKLFNLRHGIE
jgi:hypothetical protein